MTLIDLSGTFVAHAAQAHAARHAQTNSGASPAPRGDIFETVARTATRDLLPLAFGVARHRAAGMRGAGFEPASSAGIAMPSWTPSGRSGDVNAPPAPFVARQAELASAPHELPGPPPMPGPATPAPATPGHAPAAAADAGGADVDDLVERAWRALMLRLTIEQERRGYGRWA